MKGFVGALTVKIETNCDFRSPYAHFANYRVREGQLGFVTKVEWVGRPIFIDVILKQGDCVTVVHADCPFSRNYADANKWPDAEISMTSQGVWLG